MVFTVFLNSLGAAAVATVLVQTMRAGLGNWGKLGCSTPLPLFLQGELGFALLNIVFGLYLSWRLGQQLKAAGKEGLQGAVRQVKLYDCWFCLYVFAWGVEVYWQWHGWEWLLSDEACGDRNRGGLFALLASRRTWAALFGLMEQAGFGEETRDTPADVAHEALAGAEAVCIAGLGFWSALVFGLGLPWTGLALLGGVGGGGYGRSKGLDLEGKLVL